MDTPYRKNLGRDVLDPITMKALGINSLTDALDMSKCKVTVDNSIYGIPQKTIEEATDIWITLSSRDAERCIKGKDRIFIANKNAKFQRYDNETDAGALYILGCDDSVLAGFLSIECLQSYISLCQNWTSFEEISRAINRVYKSLDTNENRPDFYKDNAMGTEAVGCAIRYRAENPKALFQFRVWTDPDIWVVFYDQKKAESNGAHITLTADNVWYPPQYSLPERPKCKGGPVLAEDTYR